MKRYDPTIETGYYNDEHAAMSEDRYGDWINYHDTKDKLLAILDMKVPQSIAHALEAFVKTELT